MLHVWPLTMWCLPLMRPHFPACQPACIRVCACACACPCVLIVNVCMSVYAARVALNNVVPAFNAPTLPRSLICVCMCVCMCVCTGMYVCVHVCLHECICCTCGFY
jgi:hypothetical protein